MSLLDVLLALLIISAIILIFFIIKYLKDVTESVTKVSDSVSNLEKELENLSKEISEAIKNINEISEQGVSLTHRISTSFETIETAVNRIKNLFPASDKNKNNVIVEDAEKRTKDFVTTLKAFSAGFRTFFDTVKKK